MFGSPQSLLQQEFTDSSSRDWILLISECTSTIMLTTFPFSQVFTYYSADLIYLVPKFQLEGISNYVSQSMYSIEKPCNSELYHEANFQYATGQPVLPLEWSSYKKVLESDSFSRFRLSSFWVITCYKSLSDVCVIILSLAPLRQEGLPVLPSATNLRVFHCFSFSFAHTFIQTLSKHCPIPAVIMTDIYPKPHIFQPQILVCFARQNNPKFLTFLSSSLSSNSLGTSLVLC